MTLRLRPQRLLEAGLTLLALGLTAGIVWELARVRPLPLPSAPPVRATLSPSTAPSDTPHGPPSDTAVGAIAARSLFSAARSETTAVVAATATGPKPVLHGVLVDGDKSRAYLEDPVAKRVFGYTIGDTVGGGRLEQITDGGVVIRRADGPLELVLQDPTKPKTVATPSSVSRPAAMPPPTPTTPSEKAPQ